MYAGCVYWPLKLGRSTGLTIAAVAAVAVFVVSLVVALNKSG